MTREEDESNENVEQRDEKLSEKDNTPTEREDDDGITVEEESFEDEDERFKRLNGVITVTWENYNETITDNDFVLIYFHMDGCKYCEIFMGEFKEVVAYYAGKLVKMAICDASENAAILKRNNVRGYPSLFLFRSSTPSVYRHIMKAKYVIDWINIKITHTAKLVNDVEDFNELQNSDVSVIGYFNGDDDSNMAKVKLLNDVAITLDQLPFGVIRDANLAAQLLNTSAESILMLNKFDQKSCEYTEQFTTDKLLKWTKLNRMAYVNEITEESHSVIFGGDYQSVCVLVILRHVSEFNKSKNEFYEASKKFKGRVLFVYANPDLKAAERAIELLRIQTKDLPAIRLVNVTNVDEVTKFKPDFDEITARSIIDFTNDYLDGKLAKYWISDEIPLNWDSEPVKVLVGRNFDSIIRNRTKNVFVAFYAPWCRFSQELMPVWDELAKRYENSTKVIIAKMDATQNEISDFHVNEFPTLVLFLAHSEKHVEYNKERKITLLHKFLERRIKKHEKRLKRRAEKLAKRDSEAKDTKSSDHVHKEL